MIKRKRSRREEKSKSSAFTPSAGFSGKEANTMGGAACGLQRSLGNRALAKLSFGKKKSTVPVVKRVAPPSLQRFAFLNGTQLEPKDVDKGKAKEQSMIADSVIRDFKSPVEFSEYAEGKTDYIGSLKAGSPGTWVRYNKKGMNLLGESHILVTLNHSLDAVGSDNFIFERFLDIGDTAHEVPNALKAYNKANVDRYKEYGIENKKNRRPHASETLVPKLAFGMARLEKHLKANNIAALKSTGYVGKPIQTYLKIAWAYGEDVVVWFGPDVMKKKDTPLLKKVKPFIKLYLDIKKELDPFIQGLVEGKHLGDSLVLRKNWKFAEPLKKFATAFTEMILVAAIEFAGSGLAPKERKDLASGGPLSPDKKAKVFNQWRNTRFKQLVFEAAKRGVRYGGMGNNHLKFLKKEGLGKDMHPYHMHKISGGTKLEEFINHTKKLKSKAKAIK